MDSPSIRSKYSGRDSSLSKSDRRLPGENNPLPGSSLCNTHLPVPSGNRTSDWFFPPSFPHSTLAIVSPSVVMRNTASLVLTNPPPILPSTPKVSTKTLPSNLDLTLVVSPPPKSTMYSPGSILVSGGKVKRLLSLVPRSDNCHPSISIVSDPVFSISTNSSSLVFRVPSLLASPASPDGGSARTSLITTTAPASKICAKKSIPDITIPNPYLSILASRNVFWLMASANRVPESGKYRKRY